MLRAGLSGDQTFWLQNWNTFPQWLVVWASVCAICRYCCSSVPVGHNCLPTYNTRAMKSEASGPLINRKSQRKLSEAGRAGPAGSLPQLPHQNLEWWRESGLAFDKSCIALRFRPSSLSDPQSIRARGAHRIFMALGSTGPCYRATWKCIIELTRAKPPAG